MTNRTNGTSWIIGVFSLPIVLATFGCAGTEKSPFLQRHFSSREKSAEAAQARWNHVRGGVRRQMAADQLKAGNVDEAGRLIGEALAMSPDDPSALRLQADIQLLKGHLEAAAYSAERAVELDPDHAEGHYLVGLVAERSGNMERSVAALQRAAELNRDVPLYVLALARALVANGDEQRAARLIQERREQFAQSIQLHLLGMDLARERNDRGEAIRLAQAATRIAPDDLNVMARAGVILAWAGEYRAAAIHLKSVLDARASKKPTTLSSCGVAYPVVVRAYARSCAEIGELDQALAALKPILRDHPDDSVAWSLFCRIAISAGDTNTAYSAAHTFNRRNVSSADMLLLEGLICLQRGQRGAAMRLADAAMRADPSCAQTARELRTQAGDIDATVPTVAFFSGRDNRSQSAEVGRP